MKTRLLKYNVFNGTKEELIENIKSYKKINIISGNPEVLYNGIKNEALFNNFDEENSIIIPDGIGIVISAKLVRQPVKEKIPGIEVMGELLKYLMNSNKGVYFLGAKEEVLLECLDNIKAKFPKLHITGFHNGYFDIDNCQEIVDDIIEKNPDAIFIAMGAPRQEILISRYFQILPCSIFMGVGGSFDVYARKVNRAPRWMIKLGLEWLYRVAKEPSRIPRLLVIPKFIILVIKERYFKSRFC
jgi:N-acetylglucosaminyldiphosphoundecaprenol N-acetyl-beta-D-mannosaminyltransferase